jgi:arylsulfatase A-like enzyme
MAIMLVIALLVAAGCAKQPGPNVLIITIDTLRSDHLGCYGYGKITSPRMDEFARSGTLFESVVCQSSQTLPSHASIFLGTNPRTHKSISHESPVAPEQTTLAEILKEQGYKTGAFISSHALDSEFKLDQGFDTYWEIHKELEIPERQRLHATGVDPATGAGIQWLRRHADSRFMLWIHWFHPHRPYNPPLRYLEAFAGDYTGTVSPHTDFIMKVWREQIDLPREDVEHLINRYDAEVAFTDFQVGRVLDEVESLGLSGNTIVIITADHGEILYEHEYYFGHDIALYDECLRIPLIIQAPGLEIAQPRVKDWVQSIDILPTLLDLLDMRHPKGLEGKSLLALIAGSGASTADYFFSETFPFPEKCAPRHAVRSAEAKLIWKEDRSGPITKEFYDLAADPGETHNLYPEHPEMAAHFDSVLTSWIRHEGLHPARIPTARETGRIQILKSLGYLE